MNVQIAVARRRRADANAFVGCGAHAWRRHRRSSERRRRECRALYTREAREGRFPRWLAMRIFDHDVRLIRRPRELGRIRTGAVFDKNFNDLARLRGRDLVHRLHCFDDEQRWPSLTVAPTSMKARAPSRRHVGGAYHRRGDRVGRVVCRSGGGRCCASSRRGNRRRSGRVGGGSHRRLDILRVAGARNADAQIVLLDFNLGQIRVVEDVREIADQCLVDTVLFFSHEFCPVFLCGDVLQRGAPECSCMVRSRR